MKLIEQFEFNEPGYLKLMSYNDWRVAMLNYIDELEIENISYVESHLETDEVFVLLEGNCQMILYNDKTNDFEIISLEKNKIYNIKKGTFHNHVLSSDAKLLIVENENTNDNNSKRLYFDETLKANLMKEWNKYEL